MSKPIAEDTGPPRILTPEEASNLLAKAATTDPELVRYFAIGMFAGVRPHEIWRLQRGSIGREYIEVSASNSKSRKRRLVTICPNLAEWLQAFDYDLPTTNRRKRFEQVVKDAEITWGHDIMRHSFASYHLAAHRSADATALEMGHRDTTMLFRHYRELVTKEAAAAFWAIRPTLLR